MRSSAECSKLPRIGLAIATISLAGCATSGFEAPTFCVCPPVVEYDQGFRERAASEIQALTPGSVVETMLVDYSVMRDQARDCAR